MTSLADEIGPHLPFLRRFARALSGSQTSGDAYVAATLEAIIQDPAATLDRNLSTKVGLYRALLAIWSSIDLNHANDQHDVSPTEAAADRRLELLTPRTRQAFLLVGLEAFNRETAAAIMGVSTNEIDKLITKAGQEIAQQVATDVLIIEDEPLIAMDLEDIITSLNHRAIGVARTHREALDIVRDKAPGLILADIQLADGSSGLDAVHDLLKLHNIPVIFITAFPERLLTGERPEPAFLISKPFQPVTVRAAISQALFFDRKAGKAAA